MSDGLNILYLEDNLNDRQLAQDWLKQGGIDCRMTFACTREEYLAEINSQEWDLILADYALPDFDGLTALKLAQEICPRAPFILLSGVIGEHSAIDSLKSGATDYVLKDGMRRLCPAIRRALKEAETERELERARVEMISAARLSALGMMAAGTAHEINNPLAVIDAVVYDLMEIAHDEGSVATSTVIAACKRIQETVTRIVKIVNSLRIISRDGSNDPAAPTWIGKIVNNTLSLCRERFSSYSILFSISSISEDAIVSCCEVEIGQAFLNLLQNAFDAVVEKDGTRWIRVEVDSRDGMVRLSVLDSGRGIPNDIRRRVMDPFFTTKPVGQGVGLGLSLSRAIVEKHGGKLEMDEGRGNTCFTISLPLLKESVHETHECLSVSR